jgi:hypothetical protein
LLISIFLIPEFEIDQHHYDNVAGLLRDLDVAYRFSHQTSPRMKLQASMYF